MPTYNWPRNREYCIDASIIRDKFNKRQLYEKKQRGEVKTTIFSSRHRSPRSMPSCTKSQVLIYWENGKAVAMIHQYLRPDGTLGASGKPDPKWIIEENTIFILRASHLV